MYFAQYYLECLSQASYLVGDESTGRALVVDPRRDVREYVEDAAAHGLAIEGVVNTHFHADFLAGHLELAAQTGAWIGYGARAGEVEYPIRRLADGERLVLGDVVVEVMHTPGHTPESISLVVYEHASDPVAYGVLTGDALFIGDVGRPDLLSSEGHTADGLARLLYDSVQRRLMALPDAVRVFPAHGAGSACGKNLSTERQSTVGLQRSTNYACRPMSEAEFVEIVTEGQAPPPGYFGFDTALNRRQHPLLDVAAHLAPLTVADALRLRDAGAVVVDGRDPQDFAAGHLRGSVNVPADGRFAERAGMAVDTGTEIVVVAPAGREAEVVTRLARIGFDDVAGYLPEPELVRAPQELRAASRLTAVDLADRLAGDSAPVLLDVRGPGEVAGGAIPAALHIPLPELLGRLGEVPRGEPVVVYCQSGVRSAIAASMLRRAGHEDVSDLLGGYASWQALGAPVA